MKNSSFVIYLILLLVLDGVVLIYSSLFGKYTNYADLDGFTCPTLETRFDERKLNRTQCVLLCADSESCFGVFHDKINRRCIGCGDKFLTNMSAPALKGTQYYLRRRLYEVVMEPKTWGEAKNNCQELGGHLAVIKSQKEQSFIENHVLGNDLTDDVWIGGSRTFDGGPLYWEDDTPFSDSFTNWHPDNPSGGNEHCVELKKGYNWAWNDVYCTNSNPSICELN